LPKANFMLHGPGKGAKCLKPLKWSELCRKDITNEKPLVSQMCKRARCEYEVKCDRIMVSRFRTFEYAKPSHAGFLLHGRTGRYSRMMTRGGI
jgi:hypothetical protein